MREADGSETRRAVIAGTWYPGTRRGLAEAIDGYLSVADQQPVPGRLLGLISPHAGLAYSGQTAAYAYHQLAGRDYATVVVLAPSHRAWVGDFATNSLAAYETPLGRILLDRSFAVDLAARVSLQRLDQDAEHSLEIQLPFLQRQLGGFQLVPILMSADDPAAARRLATALAETIRGRATAHAPILLVASSDLHHIEDYEDVVRRDRSVVEAIASYDLQVLTTLLMDPHCTVCGRMPILTLLHAARELGATAARVLHHTNSGDVTGQRRRGQYTVGYASVAVYDDPANPR